MEVKVYQATLTTEEKTVRLTKPIAKQFPIRSGTRRWDAIVKGEDVPKAIGKVVGKTLGASSEWLFLVEDKEAGLAWVPPALFYPALAEKILARGTELDNPSGVPTLIL